MKEKEKDLKYKTKKKETGKEKKKVKTDGQTEFVLSSERQVVWQFDRQLRLRNWDGAARGAVDDGIRRAPTSVVLDAQWVW